MPWALGKTEVPTSQARADGERSVANVDTALLVGTREGLRHPMTVALPDDDQGVYSVIGYAFHDPGQEKTVHVDQYGARAISTYGYADYPKLAQAVSQGIALHEGRRFGVLNFWITLGFCLAVLALCITGPMMWWRRRPTGAGLAAPRGKLPIRRTWWVVLRRIPRLRNTFAVAG